ncbi:uncharacterized protein [Palaemon carinicauda]|uniref:uncharacterized protein n=1 Tax=Palaemon carinicauda TaxID=392227 RepID=UPI0035B5E129
MKQIVFVVHEMSPKNICLFKFISIAAIIVIIYNNALFYSGYTLSKNCAKSPCSITKTNNTVRQKIVVRDDVGKYRNCKSLFSLDTPAPEEMFRHIYLEKILPNETVGKTFDEIEGRNIEDTVMGIYRKFSEVLREIRKLKYLEPEKLFGENYKSLAQVLPRVADYETSHVRQRKSSRIIEGMLPFVPCLIRDYDDKMQILSCFQKRLEVKGSLYIHFLGDSKVRYLLHQFLDQTDEVFHFVTVVKVRIIVVDNYTPWVLTLHNIYGMFPPRQTIDVLSILLELHAKVVPLLKEISKRTRVLVLTQSRQRPNSEDLFPNNRGSTADFNMDWSESTFLYILQHHDKHDFKALLDSRLSKARELLRISVDCVDEFTMKSSQAHGEAQETIEVKKISPLKLKSSPAHAEAQETVETKKIPPLKLKSSSAYGKAQETVKAKKMSPLKLQSSPAHDKASNFSDRSPETIEGKMISPLEITQSYSVKSSTVPEVIYKDMFSTRYPEINLQHEPVKKMVTAFRDYLIPSEEIPGLWWWDGLLPLNLAEIEECEDMYHRGLTEETLYHETTLRCLDRTHAGDVTHHDLVTMMLNLLCNTILETSEDYCCS